MYFISPVCVHVLVCSYVAFCGNYCMFSYVPIMFSCASHVMVVYVCSQVLWAYVQLCWNENVVPAVQNIEYYPKFWRPSSCLSNSPCIPLPPDYCLVARATKISNAQKQPPDEKLVLQQCGINRTIQIHQSRVILCHIQLNNCVFCNKVVQRMCTGNTSALCLGFSSHHKWVDSGSSN